MRYSRTSLMALSLAILAAVIGSRSAAAQQYDPRIDGLLPQQPGVADPNILSDPRTWKLPGRPPSSRPAPVSAPTPSAGPESGTAPATSMALTTTSAPATATAPATMSAPATSPAPATTSAPATGPRPN